MLGAPNALDGPSITVGRCTYHFGYPPILKQAQRSRVPYKTLRLTMRRQYQPVRLAQGNDFCVPAVFAQKSLSDEEPPALVLVCTHVHGREDALRTPRTLSVLDKRSANAQTLRGRKDRVQRRR